MRAKWLIAAGMFLAVLFQVGCGTSSTSTPGQCPTCGTTVNGQYGIIDIVPVPEHNPTGEPGGPFNSFDISVTDSAHRRFYVSDRIGLDIPVFDMDQYQALFVISGANGVAGGGLNFSICDPTSVPPIPPIVTSLGNFTRYGCRTGDFGIPGFGTMGGLGPFGGFPGAQCCAARANGVNPVSGPDGEVLSPDGRYLFAGNGSSSVVVFDTFCGGANPTSCSLTTVPHVVADFPSGQSPDYDGCVLAPCPTPAGFAGFVNPDGINPCIASANGRAFSNVTCGDLRADEMSIGVVNGRTILLAANGDPALPFVTLFDVTEIVTQTGVPGDALGGPHCHPVNVGADYYPPDDSTYMGLGGALPFTTTATGNFPRCVLGQIYWDGAGTNNAGVAVDHVSAPCPDPSNFFDAAGTLPVPSGVSGTGVGVAGADVPCHHGPILNSAVTTMGAPGFFCDQAAPAAGCFGAIAIAGIGGSAFNPNTGHFLVSNASASPFTTTVGTIDEIDPRVGNPLGPVIVNSFVTPNCMPSGIVQGPGDNFLVGCGDHDGETFPPNMYVINGTTGALIATIDQVGGVDETWYNPGDNRYYLAARDMPNGPKLGVIDAATNRWLVNVTTNSNSHSVAVDSLTNHIWVPLQSGGICNVQSSNGCVGVYAQQ